MTMLQHLKQYSVPLFCPGDSAEGIIVKQVLDKERCSCLREGDIIVGVSSGLSHQPLSPTSTVAKFVTYLKRIDTGSQATFHVCRPSRECTNLCCPECMMPTASTNYDYVCMLWFMQVQHLLSPRAMSRLQRHLVRQCHTVFRCRVEMAQALLSSR